MMSNIFFSLCGLRVAIENERRYFKVVKFDMTGRDGILNKQKKRLKNE